MSARDRLHRIGMSAALAVVAVLAVTASATPASAAPQAPQLTLDAAAAAKAPIGPVTVAQRDIGIQTICTFNPGTPRRSGSQILADASVTCDGFVSSITLGVLLLRNGQPVGDGEQGVSGSPTKLFGLSDIENCSNGTWQSYALTIVVFLNGTPPAIAREALGPPVNITC